jgi:hypothetical protein
LVVEFQPSPQILETADGIVAKNVVTVVFDARAADLKLLVVSFFVLGNNRAVGYKNLQR